MLHGYLASLLEGAAITLCIAVSSLPIAVLLGLAGAAAKLSGSPPWRRAATVYTTLIRGLPDLVLMLSIFYCGQLAVNEIAPRLGCDGHVDIDPFVAGVLTIGFIFGAYRTETFRGAIIAGAMRTLAAGEIEAARSLGFSWWTVLRRIGLPSALRRSLPAYSNEAIMMLHGTSLASVVTLLDLAGAAREVNSRYFLPFEAFITAALFYLALTFVLVALFHRAEKRWLATLQPR